MVKILVAGGGIGGLAAALAASRAGCMMRLFERSPEFTEIGAGVQLGPNVTRVLHGWGLAKALKAIAACPERLQVRSASSGKMLGTLRLGSVMAARYGAPYMTVHRADLHAVLLQAVQLQTDAALYLAKPLLHFQQTPQKVQAQTSEGLLIEGDALVGADGLWSVTRQQLLGDGLPRRTGHIAYRALLPQTSLPQHLRSQDVTAWLGPRMHAVLYPVRGGEWLNIVFFVEQDVMDASPEADPWDQAANAAGLAAGLHGQCSELQELVQAISSWRQWVMYDRPPMQGAYQHALGRVALLGDAAHPMRPYLAQGAGMAIEDAAELGRLLSLAADPAFDVPVLLQHYALNRWQRNARVQARALRNGQIFHAQGLLHWGRDAAMKVLGEKLLDMPWLYGYAPKAL